MLFGIRREAEKEFKDTKYKTTDYEKSKRIRKTIKPERNSKSEASPHT